MRLGIVGCGAVVEEYHLRLLRALADRITVAGCFDPDPARARRVAAEARTQVSGDVGEALRRRGELDAVLIAAPPGAHAALIGDFLDAGVHILVEKPFVTGAAEARALAAKATAAGRRLLVGHFRRFYPSVQSARDYVGTGGIGRPRWVAVTEGRLWSWPARSSYAFTSPAGGVVLDTGSHGLDMALYILGLDEEELSFSVERVEKDSPTEPSHEVRATLRLDRLDGPLRVDLAFSRMRPLAQAVKILGERGEWLVTPTVHAMSATRIAMGMPFAVATPALDYSPADQISAFYCQYLDFLRCVAEPGYRSRADASRFVGLTAILEAVTEA